MRGTVDWAPGREHAPALTASRPSRLNAARSRVTGRRSLEVRSAHSKTQAVYIK